jgi:hypothetical protein
VQQIIAYILDYGGCHLQSLSAADATVVRAEVVERVNPHHTIAFARFKSPSHDWTFLNSIIVKQVADEPPTYVVAVIPIPSHAKISQKDEAGAVRSEVYRSFRCTQVALDVTKLEHFHSLKMKALVATTLHQTVGSKAQMGDLQSLQQYFQQLRPLSDCDEHDGRVVGRLLMNLVERNPFGASRFGQSGVREQERDKEQAMRFFVMCTSMLRECGFSRIGSMLVAATNPAPSNGPNDLISSRNTSPAVDEEQALKADEDYGRFGGPGALTNEQATSIGRLLSSSMRASPRLSTLGRVVQSVGPLREMATRYNWFVPMMEEVVKRQLPVDQPSIRSRLMSRKAIFPGFLGADKDVLDSFDSVDATDMPTIASQLETHLPNCSNFLSNCFTGIARSQHDKPMIRASPRRSASSSRDRWLYRGVGGADPHRYPL